MKKQSIYILFLAFILLIACIKEKKQADEAIIEETAVEEVVEIPIEKVIINLTAKSDSNVSGNAVFTEEPDGSVKMVALLSNLSEGTHAIHLHEKADCSSADGTSTGGHWNPTGQPHGKWGSEAGYHKGDIGNFEADTNGNGIITFTTDQWCIGCDDETKNIIGKAVIVHQGIDDYVSQPSGAAGSRISCGGIIE